MNSPQTTGCTVRKRLDYRSAPIGVLEDQRLSSESKVLVTWALMHSNGWETHIGHALKMLGISQGIWDRRVREELIRSGYFVQSVGRGVKDGREVMIWANIFTDTPLLYLHFEGIENEGLRNEGITKTRKVNKGLKQQQPAAACDIDELIEALLWEKKKSGKTIHTSRGGWENSIRKVKKAEGLTAADRTTIEDYRKYKQRLAAKKPQSEEVVVPSLVEIIRPEGTDLALAWDEFRISRDARPYKNIAVMAFEEAGKLERAAFDRFLANRN